MYKEFEKEFILNTPSLRLFARTNMVVVRSELRRAVSELEA